MWKPIYQPEPWQQFVKRKDIKGLPLMEQRKKYMQEQLLFENYLSTLNTLNTVSPSVSSAASGGGGPLPGGGGPKKETLSFKIDTNYNWHDNINSSLPSTTIMFTYGVGSSFIPSSEDDFPGEITIDWGDGNVETLDSYNFSRPQQYSGLYYFISHSYASDGEYTITATGENAYDVKFSYLPLTELVNYDITKASNTRNLFAQANLSNFTTDITNWDVSHISDFRYTFYGWNRYASTQFPSNSFTFNQDISGWDVSNATSLATFLCGQSEFNQDLGSWNTSKVENFQFMFRDCYKLLSGARADLWDVSGQTATGGTTWTSWWEMFRGSMRDSSVVGSMPHIGNWEFGWPSDGSASLRLYFAFADSGLSHTSIGETLIGWASQSALPLNVGTTRPFQNTWDGSGFSNPVFNTGSAFGLEVSASFALLTSPTGSGGKGWTIENISFI